MAGVEQPFDCLVIQNRQAMHSMGRSKNWTVKDNKGNGLFFCATHTSHRSGHIPSVQAGAETSDVGAEAVKSDTRCTWQGNSRRVGADVGDECKKVL